MTPVGKLDALSEGEARELLLRCCGSKRWVERMLGKRPFRDVDALTGAADALWWALDRDDWLEAFAAHPRIGDRRDVEAKAASTKAWSTQEQRGVDGAGADVLADLAEANRAYEEKFGHVFLVCATGKTAAEMLAIARQRLANGAEPELRVAAEEQRKITRLRLDKLLKELASQAMATPTTTPQRLSTHVLDTARGRPAQGVPLVLEIERAGVWHEIGRGETDADGRNRALLGDRALEAATYRLTFDTSAYARATGGEAFFPHVTIAFSVRDPSQHHHVPLLLSPFGYSTYRGS